VTGVSEGIPPALETCAAAFSGLGMIRFLDISPCTILYFIATRFPVDVSVKYALSIIYFFKIINSKIFLEIIFNLSNVNL